MLQKRELEDQVLSAVRQFADSIKSGQKTVADMSPLAEATSRLPLTGLDDWERLLRRELSRAVESSKPAKWKFWAQPIPFLTWIDLCSGDGFKRERTLRTLSGAAPNSFFLAVAVRRLNDWVSEVRAAARERLLPIAEDTDPENVVDVLCAVLPHWNSWRHMGENGKQVLREITSVDAIARSLKSRILTATAGPMTSLLAQAGQTPFLDGYLNEIAKNAVQPAVRAKAYRCLLDGKMVWVSGQKWEWIDVRYCKGHFKPILCERPLSIAISFEKTLGTAILDRSPMVRRVAGEVLIRELETLGSQSLKFADLLASDSHPSVAASGKFALRKLSLTGPDT